MSLADHYPTGQLGISFELYPPRTDKGMETLMVQVERLMKFKPNYITCTYGAGGATRDKTLDIVEAVKNQFQVPVASHLTCVGSSVDELRGYLAEAQRRGVDYIVALRGDPPMGETTFTPDPNGLRYANELVALIASEFDDFGVVVAGYPEVHREAPCGNTDLENLKRKVDAGADVIVTQLFFCNQDFYDFRERCTAAGITVPIVPGIFPVINFAQITKIASLCGAYVPPELTDKLAERPDDAQWHFDVGVDFAARQVQDLADHGIPGLHFYVLNQSEATSQILESLQLPEAK